MFSRKTPNKAAWLCVCVVWLHWSQGSLAQSPAEKVRPWLDRMSLAVNNLNYRGTLVYLRNSRYLEAIRLYHRVESDGTVSERMISLSGPIREVLRDETGVQALFQDRQSVIVDARVTEPWFPIIPPDQVDGGDYHYSLGPTERIAGYSAQRVNVIPRDGMRYGHRLWLEKNTGMLLKSELLDEKRGAIEVLMFTDLEIGANITDSDLTPELRSEDHVQIAFPTQAEERELVGNTAWKFDRLPAGFMLTEHRLMEAPGKGRQEHLLYSDGLASVSVYVEPVAEGERFATGARRMGALNMFGIVSNGFAITAVGEVPSSTVEEIARSARRTDG